MAEIEETIKRIQTHKGVRGIIIFNNEGAPVRSTIDSETAVQYSRLLHSLITKAKSVVRDIDSTNELCFLRLNTKKHEIMLAPDKDYYLIVIKASES